MAVKLVDIAAGMTDPRQRAYIEMFARSTPLMGEMPIEEAPRGFMEVEREVSLGSAGFRSFNEAYTESTGRSEIVKFETKIVGGDVDIDKGLVRRGGPEARARAEARKAKAVFHKVDYTIVNGDESSDPEEFNGFKTLVTGTAKVHANNSGTPAGLKLIDLDTAIAECDGATHLYMKRKMIVRLSASTRATGVSGYLRHDFDSFGRQIMFYNGLPIIEADPPGHNEVPLGFNEGSSDTSIYVLNLSGDGLCMLQMSPLDYSDLGETDAKAVLRTRLEWDCGLALKNPRSVVRLSGVTDAAVAA